MRAILAGLLTALLVCVSFAPAADKDDKPDVDGLIKQLQDEDAGSRVKAARALGRLGPKAKDAVAPLKEALKDKDDDVRAAARTALEKIKGSPDKDPKFADVVKDLRSKNGKSRMKALTAIGEMGEEAKPIAPLLVETMLQANPMTWQMYYETLEKIDPESQKLILALVTEQTPDKKLEAIDNMEALGEEGKACIPVLVKFYYLDRTGKLSKDLSFAQRIVPALVKIGPDDKAVAQTVLAAVSVQGRFQDSAVRMKAIEALKDLSADPKMVVKALTSALVDPNCRLQAIEAMGTMGPDAKDALPVLGKLKFDTNKEVREAAAAAIEMIKEAKDKDKEKDK